MKAVGQAPAMSLRADQVDDSIHGGLAAARMLNASCQAVIEAQIAKVNSPWYGSLDALLGEAEGLVVGWRRGGGLHYQDEVVATVATVAKAFATTRAKADALFAQLESEPDPEARQALVAALQGLDADVQVIVQRIDGFDTALKQFQSDMSSVQQKMQQVVADVQAQENQIKSEIEGINAKIAAMNREIQVDREAIAKARAAEKEGVIETIFGIAFAPITGGLSLILAGIGVSSIEAAEHMVGKMEQTIRTYQQDIVQDQSKLGRDQRIVATLGTLVNSTQMVLGDLDHVQHALDALRADWVQFGGEFQGVIHDLAQAESPDVVGQAWFHAACDEWSTVSNYLATMNDEPPRTQLIDIH